MNSAPLSRRTPGCRLAGKVAFITGAASGQGRAEAIRLAQGFMAR